MRTQDIKIALIEDDTALITMYMSKLQHEGFNVQTAPNVTAGLELIKMFQPNVILLDIMMPESTGVELLEHLRQVEMNDKVKVIILTNLDDAKLRASVEQMGIDSYLVKANVTPSEIVDKIKSLFP